ncbi:hypothetical protein Trydic_g14686, partial [Trypoxylus dichotomus]
MQNAPWYGRTNCTNMLTRIKSRLLSWLSHDVCDEYNTQTQQLDLSETVEANPRIETESNLEGAVHNTKSPSRKLSDTQTSQEVQDEDLGHIRRGSEAPANSRKEDTGRKRTKMAIASTSRRRTSK